MDNFAGNILKFLVQEDIEHRSNFWLDEVVPQFKSGEKIVFTSKEFISKYQEVSGNILFREAFKFVQLTDMLKFIGEFKPQWMMRSVRTVADDIEKNKIYLLKNISIPEMEMYDKLYISAAIVIRIIKFESELQSRIDKFMSYEDRSEESLREIKQLLGNSRYRAAILRMLKGEPRRKGDILPGDTAVIYDKLDYGVVSKFDFGMHDVDAITLPDIMRITAAQYSRLYYLKKTKDIEDVADKI